MNKHKLLLVFMIVTLIIFCINSISLAQISNLQKNLNQGNVSTTKKAVESSSTQPSVSNTSEASSKAKSKNTSSTSTKSTSSGTILMSDEEFTNENFVTESELRGILKMMNSQLQNPIEGVDVVSIIMEVSKECKINPLVLLTTLQKESGLVQTKKKLSKTRLDWAMGVGVYDSGRKNLAYKGFKKQLEGAAEVFKKCFDRGKELLSSRKSVSLKINYGKSTVLVSNAATYSLYAYTPHTSGNKLFMSIYKSYKSRIEKYRLSNGSSARINN